MLFDYSQPPSLCHYIILIPFLYIPLSIILSDIIKILFPNIVKECIPQIGNKLFIYYMIFVKIYFHVLCIDFIIFLIKKIPYQ